MRQFLPDCPHAGLVRLADGPVVADQTVGFVLHIGKLGINGGAEAWPAGRMRLRPEG